MAVTQVTGSFRWLTISDYELRMTSGYKHKLVIRHP